MEKSFIILWSVFLVAAFALLMPYLKTRRKRKKLLASPLPPSLEKILRRNVPLYGRMPDTLKIRLQGLINVFLEEKDFEGCGGLVINDEIRVTVAGQACMLLLNGNQSFFPTLRTILVYPSTYFADGVRRIGNQFIQDETARLGESWIGGAVVLAWDHVRNGAIHYNDGHNVVIHEFAHQLDQEDGYSDGTPVILRKSDLLEWKEVIDSEYKRLRFESEHGMADLIDSYGATNPAEFFAVASETYFEQPEEMKARHSQLFEILKKYYKIDSSEWLTSHPPSY
jgi:Mlc titration factor MtfA (ptsG expression regulator)